MRIKLELLQAYVQKLTSSALPPRHYSEGQLIFVPADPKKFYDFIMYQEEEGVQQGDEDSILQLLIWLHPSNNKTRNPFVWIVWNDAWKTNSSHILKLTRFTYE